MFLACCSCCVFGLLKQCLWSLPSGQNWGKIPTKKGKLSGRKLKEEQRASLELQRVACASPTSRWQCVYTSVTVFVWTTDVLFKKLQVCQKKRVFLWSMSAVLESSFGGWELLQSLINWQDKKMSTVWFSTLGLLNMVYK